MSSGFETALTTFGSGLGNPDFKSNCEAKGVSATTATKLQTVAHAYLGGTETDQLINFFFKIINKIKIKNNYNINLIMEAVLAVGNDLVGDIVRKELAKVRKIELTDNEKLFISTRNHCVCVLTSQRVFNP